MENTENEIIQCSCTDYSEYIQSILDNQATEIELLTEQRDCMVEQINGLTMVINYQFATIGIIVVFTVVSVAWKILSKWFFGGV